MTFLSVKRRGHRLPRKLKDERGYTLSEMVVSMAIMGMVIGAVATLFESGSRAEVDLNLRFAAQTEARVALDTFRREVHNACSATVSGTAATVVDPAGVSKTRSPTVALQVLDSTYRCTVASSSWCTVGSGTNFGLYRQSGAGTCNSASVRRAQFLTRGTVFIVTSATTLLPKVGIDLTINEKPARANLAYRIHDDIALRNAVRG